MGPVHDLLTMELLHAPSPSSASSLNTFSPSFNDTTSPASPNSTPPPSPFLSTETYNQSKTDPRELNTDLPDIPFFSSSSASIYPPYVPDYEPRRSCQSKNTIDRPPRRITICWFWYHKAQCNRFYNRKACPYQHRIAPHLVLVPPPGFVHREACYLPLCPLRSADSHRECQTNTDGDHMANQDALRHSHLRAPSPRRFRSRNVCPHWYYTDTCGYSMTTCPQAHRTGRRYILPSASPPAPKRTPVKMAATPPLQYGAPNETSTNDDEKRQKRKARKARWKERKRLQKQQYSAAGVDRMVKTGAQGQEHGHQTATPYRRRTAYKRSTRPLLSLCSAAQEEGEAEFYFSDEEGEIHSDGGGGEGAEWFLEGFPDAGPVALKTYTKDDGQRDGVGADDGVTTLKKTGQWAFLFGKGTVEEIEEGEVEMETIDG